MSRNLKLIQTLLYLFSSVFVAYGLIVLAIIGSGHWFNYFFIVAGVIIFAVGIIIGRVRRCSKRIITAVSLILLFCFCNFAIFEYNAISMGVRGENLSVENLDSQPKWIIVLGAKVDQDKSPKREFAVRLWRAEELCTKDSVLILTGGQGKDEPISEAQSGFDYITGRNKLESKNIILEDKSTSTSENLKNSLSIIEDNGGSVSDHVLIISSGFHLYRASKIAENIGFTNADYAGAAGLKILVPYYYVREFAAYIREFVM